MTSPYRTQHTFSVRSPDSTRKYNDSSDTSVNIATAIHNSKRGENGTSYYASPSSKFAREKTVDVLDIRNIDHDVIRNDPDLRSKYLLFLLSVKQESDLSNLILNKIGLSRNPSAFNTSLFDDENDDEAYCDEEEDSEDDLFAEEERLVENPEEESQLRTLIAQSSSLSSNQNVPDTPKRMSSFFSAIDGNIDSSTYNKQYDFNKSAPYKSNSGTGIGMNYDNSNGDDNNNGEWEEYIKQIFFKILRACVFQLFMIYWIVKEPIIRLAAFFTMMVSTFFVDPALYIWSKLPNNQNWIPSHERRKQITTISTLIFFFSLSIKTSPYISPYLPTSLSKSVDYLHSYKSNYYQAPQQSSNPDLSKLVKGFNKDHTEIWSIIEKLKSDHEKFEKDQSQMSQENKKIWSELGLHQSKVESLNNENSKIWTKLEDQQIASENENEKIWTKLKEHEKHIDQIQQSINSKIQDTIGSQLPENILVQTNKKGELKLSPQFYALLQDPSLWDIFLKQNEEAINKYLAGEMNRFYENQQKQGAVIGKESLTKQMSNHLDQYRRGSKTGGEMAITLEELIDKAISKYHQDVLNTADYSLESRGARIIHSITSPTYHRLPAWLQSVRQAAGLSVVSNAAEMALKPQTHAGECWSMYGNQGSLGIALSEAVIVQGVSIEYPSLEIMTDKMKNAPKEMELYGIKNYPKDLEERVLIGLMQYDINKDKSIQTFDLVNPTEVYSAVLLLIKSNWGSLEHTDIYRVRIHGLPV